MATEKCLMCGTELVPLGNEEVNGRYVKSDAICPLCHKQCPNCGNWYSNDCNYNIFDANGICSNCPH